jgi:cytochrome c-type biogenesis protein CcmF
MTGDTGAQNSTTSIATFDVTKGGRQIGTLAPHTDVYPMSGAAVRAVILGRPLEDLFVVADEPFDGTSKRIALRMVIFPLVRWVWIGSILLCVGAAVSLWPKARRQEQEVRAAAPVTDADGRLDGASA